MLSIISTTEDQSVVFFFFCRDRGAHPATLPAGAVLVLAVQADTKPRGLLRDVWAG